MTSTVIRLIMSSMYGVVAGYAGFASNLPTWVRAIAVTALILSTIGTLILIGQKSVEDR